MLKGKTAVVTGGGRGIGAAIVRKLAEEGLNVAIIYAGSREAAESLCDECRDAFGVDARAYRCDVSDFQAVKDLCAEVKKDFGSVHCLVNNAGITRDGLIPVMKESDFDAVIDTNLKGTFNMIRHFSGIMMRGRFGRIVNVSSVSGITGNPGQANYSASKAGVIALTKTAAKELAAKGITCNAVAPGFVETDMTAGLESKKEQLISAIPLGRFAAPEEIADAVWFLLRSEYITGEVLRVDGGIAI
ncbi:MAG: 3-oxoacyl-[Oscillospiraceae bacterium]|nr:3-oxoacyl-[acyl-carrier-protein] reductase [Oscillospiraceae bacterium]MCR5173679.1 3-oxoacyl-[acyl-carrier-protein] reductase [Oscillospiraceae bacterium]